MRISIRPKILDILILFVEISGETGEWIEPLETDKEIAIPGSLGVTHVHIEDGKVSIDDSPCDNKLCISMGKIWLVHQWVACLPNGVFVRIRGRTSGGEDLDATTF
jgi:hypothetical protein